MITRRNLLKLLGVATAALATGAAYPFAEAQASANVTRYALTPRNWTPGLSLRIAVLADIHACEPWMGVRRIEGICATTEALGADLILLLGDYVSGMRMTTGKVANAAWAAPLGRPKAPRGVHAVLGNHDYWEDRTFQKDPRREPAALGALRDVGISTHINRAVRLEKDGHGFWLAGLGDQLAVLPSRTYGRKRMEGIDDLAATLSGVSDDAPVILMAHEPDIFPSVPKRVNLTLSGHTHGQIDVLGWLLSPPRSARGSTLPVASRRMIGN